VQESVRGIAHNARIEQHYMLTSNPLTGTIVSRLSVSVTYTAVPEGTKITTVVEGEPKGFFKLAEGLVVSSLEKNLEEDQNHLKAILEGV